MKALSLRQAASCEQALHPKCRCSCHGTCHGTGRAAFAADGDRTFFEALPKDDPHRLLTFEETADRRREKRDPARLDAAEAAGTGEAERIRQWNQLVTGVRR